MGLLKIIRKTKKLEKEIRLLILGLDNAGKTTLLMGYLGERMDDIPPTVGFNIKTVQVDRFKVNVWDVGGQKSIRSFWRNYFDTTDGLIWVIDSSDADRMRDCRDELHSLLKEERLAGASLLVMANKQDIPGALGIVEIEEFLGISEIKRTRHCAIVPCSAFSKDSITDGFHWIIHDIGERIYTLR